MEEPQFNQVIEDQINDSFDLLVSKNGAYNPGTDKLHNFKVAAKLQGISTKKALAGMMAKHTTSVYDLCDTGDDTDAVPMDVWNEKITDHINYLLLLKAVLVDEQNQFATSEESENQFPEPVPASSHVNEQEEADSHTVYKDVYPSQVNEARLNTPYPIHQKR